MKTELKNLKSENRIKKIHCSDSGSERKEIRSICEASFCPQRKGSFRTDWANKHTLLVSNTQAEIMRTEDMSTFFVSFSPEYLQNSALPSQVVSGRQGTKNEMKKGHPKIFQKIRVKTLLSKYTLYFKSPFLWTVLWDENRDVCQI